MVAVRPDGPEFLSLRRASRELGIGRSTLKHAIRAGELAASQPGARTILVSRTAVLQWLDGHRVPVTDHARARVAKLLEREGAHGGL